LVCPGRLFKNRKQQICRCIVWDAKCERETTGKHVFRNKRAVHPFKCLLLPGFRRNSILETTKNCAECFILVCGYRPHRRKLRQRAKR
jgi:hypothetical protein